MKAVTLFCTLLFMCYLASYVEISSGFSLGDLNSNSNPLNIIQCVSNFIVTYEQLGCVVAVPCNGNSDAEWYKDNVRVTDSADGKYEFNNFESDCVLFTSFKIVNATSEDDGTYKLQVYDYNTGSVVSNDFIVTVTEEQ